MGCEEYQCHPQSGKYYKIGSPVHSKLFGLPWSRSPRTSAQRQKARIAAAARRANRTPSQKQRSLDKAKARRANRTPSQKQRSLGKAKARRANRTPSQKQRSIVKAKARRVNRTPSQKQRSLDKARIRRANNAPVESFILQDLKLNDPGFAASKISSVANFSKYLQLNSRKLSFMDWIKSNPEYSRLFANFSRNVGIPQARQWYANKGQKKRIIDFIDYLTYNNTAPLDSGVSDSSDDEKQSWSGADSNLQLSDTEDED
jgi:hypothetical protein